MAVVGEVRLGPGGGKLEIISGVGQRGGSIQGGNVTGRDEGPEMMTGCTKLATEQNRGTYPSAPVAAVLGWNITTK